MDKFANQIKDNWVILAFLVGIVMWYANINSRVTAVEAQVNQQELVISQIADIKTDVAVIKANVTFIKENLNK